MKFTRIMMPALLAASFTFASTAMAGDKGVKKFKPGQQSIATVAVENGSFTTLVQALTCTDLVGVAANPAVELTVFAPTDDAFGALGLNAGNICDVFDTETLSTILLYHVVDERRPSPSVVLGQNKDIEMMAGGSIYPEGRGSLALFDNLGRQTNVVIPDVLASNGIIHVVDNVLLPVAP